MYRARLLVCGLLALSTAGCETPAPPPVAVHAPSLDADDMAVLRALFDDVLRPQWREAIRTGKAPVQAPRFLVVSRTMAMCRRDPGVLGPQPGRCLSADHANIIAEVVRPDLFPTVRLNFQAWNAKSLTIAGSLGEDVTLVSPTLLDMMPLSELLRSNPGSAVVTLSAPGYLAPGVAVITFGGWTGSGGAARIERQQDGRWRIVASASHPQD
jgi:hypothetical protein